MRIKNKLPRIKYWGFLFAVAIIAPAFFYIGYASSAQAAISFDVNLAFGSRGPAVTDLQQFLTDQKLYTGPITGNFFTLTRQAVQAFQLREKITPAAGYFGPKSRARANQLLSDARRSKIEADLKVVQGQIAELQKTKLTPATTTPSTATSNATSTATSTGPTLVPSPSPESLISARSIVGLDCFFQGPGTQTAEARGSGVIITPNGLILTVRHLVDLKFSYTVDPQSVQEYLANNFSLDHCDVGQVPEGSALPSPDAIRSLNPFISVPRLNYRAGLFYLPQNSLLSQSEMRHLDFALLKIASVSEAGFAGGLTDLPPKFDYAVLDRTALLSQGTEVLSYGYPGDITRNRSQDFSQMYLLGSVGKVKEVFGGDALFVNQSFVINTEMEVRSGRSGSPVFVNGKVIGIVNSHATDNVTDSFSLSSVAIYRIIVSVLPNLP